VAGRLNRSWYAVYVQTPSEDPTVIDAKIQRLISNTLTLAKQLGAIVFTFKGEDIVSTVLQFAKEYRVGHIVIGSPDKIPFRKRIFGKRSIAERLILEARGVTVVVLDTKTSESEYAPKVEEKAVLKKPSPSHAPSPEDDHGGLSRFLPPKGILIWNEPVARDVLLQGLTEVAAQCANNSHQSLKYLSAILERETQGSTFFNEGVAFPHARIEGLEQACVAFGLTHGGVSDVTTEKPIECVFLILSPMENPDQQIQILGLASKLAQDRHLMGTLQSAMRPDEAYEAIRDWEFVQNNKTDE
jgi:two-component system sensor histidine kinase KdpD